MKSSNYSFKNYSRIGSLLTASLFVLCSLIYSAPAEHGFAASHGRQPRGPAKAGDEAGVVVVATGLECVRQLPESLQKLITDCTLVEGLDPAKARDTLAAGRPLDIPVANKRYSLVGKLDPSLFAATAIKGQEPERGESTRNKATSNSFVGGLVGIPTSDAGITISDDDRFIYGFACTSPRPDDQIFFETFIEPQRRELPRVLTYKGSDVLLKFMFGDDTTMPKTAPSLVNDSAADPEATNQIMLGHGDGSYLTSMGGSLSGAFAQMEFVMTCVRLWYQQRTNVMFQIGELWMRFSNFGPTEAAALRDSFTTHMESAAHQPAATYHVAELFTGVNTDGTTIGISTFPGAGVLGHYAIAQMVVDAGFYDATVFGKGILVAHETGHLYNASHGSCNPGPPADIMCAGGLGGPETRIVSFSPASTGLINAQVLVKGTR